MDVFTNLNNHLFDQLNRLSADMSDEQLQAEINRAAAVTSVAKEVINNANLRIQAVKIVAEHKGLQTKDALALLGKTS